MSAVVRVKGSEIYTGLMILQNILLRAAVRARRPLLLSKLETVAFKSGQQFWTPDKPTPYALFPLHGSISHADIPIGRKTSEVAVVGREGFAGVSLFLGANSPRGLGAGHVLQIVYWL